MNQEILRIALNGVKFVKDGKFGELFNIAENADYPVQVSALFQKEDPWKKMICLR